MNHGFYYNGVRQYGFQNVTNPIGLHEWTHYCHVFDNGIYRIYIQGVDWSCYFMRYMNILEGYNFLIQMS